jgi:putative glutamine amidotransferase
VTEPYHPLIAIAAYHLDDGRVSRWPHGGYGVPARYVDALRQAGARSAIVPPGDPGDAEQLLEPFDGLLLVGGGDVDPKRYGREPGDELYGVEPDRDDLEIGLLHAAGRMGAPALCICRGMQVMNVAFGGTLHEHLPGMPGLIEHGVPIANTVTTHEVQVAPRSRLFATTKSSRMVVSSHHHQGVATLGTGIEATGFSGDGLVEAIERGGGWMLGVQWHPEETAEADEAQRSLFEGLALLARVGIPGTPPRHRRVTRPVRIAEPNPGWPADFEREERRIAGALGDLAVRIEHVGSTAVPGLAAKPVIDIQVSVGSMEPRSRYVRPLVALGYRHALDPVEPDHEYFSHDAEGTRRYQIHVCAVGSEWERRHLAFRDALRRNPQDAREYERLKRELAARYPDDVYTYTEDKSEWISRIERREGATGVGADLP